MVKAVAEFEIGLTQEELENFTELAHAWNKDFPETVRECMNTHCEKMLDMFANNTPENEDTGT